METLAFAFAGFLPLLPVLIYWVGSRVSLLSPLSILGILFFFATTLKFWLTLLFDPTLEEHSLLFDNETSTLAGIVLITIGVFSFVAAYAGTRRRKALQLADRPVRMAWLGYAYWPFVAVCLGMTYFYLQYMGVIEDLLAGRLQIRRFAFTESGERTSLTFLLQGAKWLQVAVLVKIAYRQKLQVIDLALLAPALFAPLITSDRTGVALFAIALLITGSFSGFFRSLSARAIRLALMAVLAIGLIVSGALRTIGEADSGQDFVTTVTTGLVEAGEQYAQRPYLAGPEKLGLIYEVAGEDVPFMWGESIIAIVFAPIPRIWWEEKPSVRVGQFVGKEIYLRDNLSGVPPTLIGELYLNFWWPGVILGMALLGALSRRLYTRLALGPLHIIIYALFASNILIVSVSSDLNGGLLQFLLAAAALPIMHAYFAKPQARGIPSRNWQPGFGAEPAQ